MDGYSAKSKPEPSKETETPFSRPEPSTAVALAKASDVATKANTVTATAPAHLPDVTIHNFAQVSPGIFRGAAPSPSQVEELKNLGVKTIIDLRVPDSDFHKEQDAAKAAGINYFNEPLFYDKPSIQKMSNILEILNDPAAQPVYVHCRDGEDRTGTVIGEERRLVDGWDFKNTYSEMLHYGFHPIYKDLADFVKKAPKEFSALNLNAKENAPKSSD